MAAAAAAAAALLAVATAPTPTAADGLRGIFGERRQWHTLSADFDGPYAKEWSTNNPFLNYRLDCTWTHVASGAERVVPGFFAADGNAAVTSSAEGRVWRCHFAPPRTGRWALRASFRKGWQVAIAADRNAGAGTSFHGAMGSVDVGGTDKGYPDFRRRGKLVYSSSRYMRTQGSKEVFLRVGPNSPENILGYNVRFL